MSIDQTRASPNGDELIATVLQAVRVNPLTSMVSGLALGGLLVGALRLASRHRKRVREKGQR